MAEYYRELLATMHCLERERSKVHLLCGPMRWHLNEHGHQVYSPNFHCTDCFLITQELIRLVDVFEFVVNPKSYNPGSVMRQVMTGRYNLRKQTWRHPRANCFVCSALE